MQSKKNFSDSSVYQNFLREREEILKLKWIESEKKGEDIGFEKALITWVMRHRKDWQKYKNKD